jgi:hypothetical protein
MQSNQSKSITNSFFIFILKFKFKYLVKIINLVDLFLKNILSCLIIRYALVKLFVI